ncbi:NADH dehydrogenase [ubiquinone] 1 beta subcomplex subunit 2, mitochondrial [Bulinus truncatus]|nr:NADH dehydrogenase [ubiquinone] 1 beta subcomplex subunit 2, mitochondrial [Bulinus truncatus]
MNIVLGRLRPIIATVCQHNKSSLVQKNNVRHSGSGTYLYRRLEPGDSSMWHYAGDALSAFLWYWMLYHCYYEYEHLVPSYKYPDSSKFTNEELGIPPDDE